MLPFHARLAIAFVALTAWLAGSSAAAQPAQAVTLNVYSARHYPSDEALYQGFTQATGIRVQRVESDDAGILARLKTEGRASPADVVLLVDASRLWRAEADSLFLPVRSTLLEGAIPAPLRARPEADGSIAWWGLSTRARVIVYDKARIKRADVDRYEKLADARLKGRLCIRSGSHPYNLSLFGAMVEHLGEEATEAWLQGVVANLARAPKGGDTDQIRSVAAGECAVALTNSYYLARLMRSTRPEDQAVVARLGVVFPNQADRGTHVNVAGGAVARSSRNVPAAIRFLEYLASPAAQAHFADGNNEWPVVRGVTFDNPALKAMTGGSFKPESLPAHRVGMNQVKVQQMLDRVGFK